jgi:hypothetical protein
MDGVVQRTPTAGKAASRSSESAMAMALRRHLTNRCILNLRLPIHSQYLRMLAVEPSSAARLAKVVGGETVVASTSFVVPLMITAGRVLVK